METFESEETANDEEPNGIMEDMNTETSTALVQEDISDPHHIKNKGRKLIPIHLYLPSYPGLYLGRDIKNYYTIIYS